MISILTVLEVILISTLLMVLYTKFQLDDLKNYTYSTAPRLWHIPGALMRAVIPIALIVGKYGSFEIIDVLIASSISLPVWDMLINKAVIIKGKLGMKKETIWHVGSTDPFDKFLGQGKWYLYAILIVAFILIKIFT